LPYTQKIGWEGTNLKQFNFSFLFRGLRNKQEKGKSRVQRYNYWHIKMIILLILVGYGIGCLFLDTLSVTYTFGFIGGVRI
jgi:hypothetical protein